jgi:tRNA U34 5-carboxymethylaminomethyl modifying GTPase MnmE/TrmE
LKEASFYISSCLEKKDIKQLDLIAEDLRLAINSINLLVGEVNVEKLLDIIFQEYCIGK